MILPFTFDLINILISITIFINAILAVFIYLKGGHTKGSKAYLFVIFSILLWCITMIGYRSSSSIDLSIIWAKILYASATLTAAGFLYFSFVFPNNKLSFQTWKKVALLVFNLFLIIISLYENKIIKQVIFSKEGAEKLIIFGDLYYIYFLYTVVIFSLGFYNLFKNYRTSQDIEKIQIRYVFIGYFVAANLAMFSNLVLPTLNYFSFNWIGQIFTVIMVTFTTYAILKHNLLDIRVITTELFAFLVNILLLIRIFLSVSAEEMLLNIGMFIAIFIFSLLLIRSVWKEVRTREELEVISEQLAAANEKLKLVDQAKTEFISIASHQLRTPLTAIKGYSSMIIEGSFGGTTKKVQDVVQKIFDSSQKLVLIIGNFLDVSRIELGKMQYEFGDFDLAEMVKTVTEETAVIIKKSPTRAKVMEISFEPEPGKDYKIHGDPNKIQQVFSNLIDNAMKYTKEGKIEVFLSRDNVKKTFLIKIKDTGIGIPKKVIPTLFQKFTRANGLSSVHSSGSGLGLYVAKEIVKEHKGNVWVESEGVGKGSTFFIELPVGELGGKEVS